MILGLPRSSETRLAMLNLLVGGPRCPLVLRLFKCQYYEPWEVPIWLPTELNNLRRLLVGIRKQARAARNTQSGNRVGGQPPQSWKLTAITAGPKLSAHSLNFFIDEPHVRCGHGFWGSQSPFRSFHTCISSTTTSALGVYRLKPYHSLRNALHQRTRVLQGNSSQRSLFLWKSNYHLALEGDIS